MDDTAIPEVGLGEEKVFARECKRRLRKSKLAAIRAKRESKSSRIPSSKKPTETDVFAAQHAEEDATVDMTAAQENVESAIKLVKLEKEHLKVVQNEAEEATLVRSTGHAEMLRSAGNPIDYRRAAHLQLQVSDIEIKLAVISQRRDVDECRIQDNEQKAILKRQLKSLKEELNSINL